MPSAAAPRSPQTRRCAAHTAGRRHRPQHAFRTATHQTTTMGQNSISCLHAMYPPQSPAHSSTTCYAEESSHHAWAHLLRMQYCIDQVHLHLSTCLHNVFLSGKLHCLRGGLPQSQVLHVGDCCTMSPSPAKQHCEEGSGVHHLLAGDSCFAHLVVPACGSISPCERCCRVAACRLKGLGMERACLRVLPSTLSRVAEDLVCG